MNLLWSLIIGGVAGWLAGKLMKGDGYGLVVNILLGLVGEYFLSMTLAGSWLRGPLAAVVPNLQFFWPADALTAGHEIPVWHLGQLTLYAAGLAAAALAVAVALFQSRDVG